MQYGYLVLVYNQAVKLLVPATMQLFRLHSFANVDVPQAGSLGYELTSASLAGSWCARHQDVWRPSGHATGVLSPQLTCCRDQLSAVISSACERPVSATGLEEETDLCRAMPSWNGRIISWPSTLVISYAPLI